MRQRIRAIRRGADAGHVSDRRPIRAAGRGTTLPSQEKSRGCREEPVLLELSRELQGLVASWGINPVSVALCEDRL